MVHTVRARLGDEIADVAAQDQRGIHHRPQGEVRLVLRLRQVAVADLEHVGVVVGARLLVRPEGDRFFVVAYDGIPACGNVAGSTPGVGKFARPGPGAGSAVLTDGEENRLLFRAGLLGNACRRLFQGVAHLGIPADGVRLLAVDGVEDLDGVFARVQVDIDLLAAGVAPAAGARDRRLIGALPIDLDLRIFGRGGGGLLKADGQDVLTRLVHRLVEGDGTAVCAQAGHVAGAVAAAPVDHSGVPLQNGVLRLELFALRRARLCDRDVVHIRRLCIAGVADIGPHIDHMAIVILQVFDAPLRKGLGVQFFIPRRTGHILAGEVAAGAVYAYLERVLRVERVNLLDEIRAAREAREVKLHPAVFVAHIGLPAVVQIEIHVSVIV